MRITCLSCHWCKRQKHAARLSWICTHASHIQTVGPDTKAKNCAEFLMVDRVDGLPFTEWPSDDEPPYDTLKYYPKGTHSALMQENKLLKADVKRLTLTLKEARRVGDDLAYIVDCLLATIGGK
jgi:hypothetical protein